jgi:hypothetical protein
MSINQENLSVLLSTRGTEVTRIVANGDETSGLSALFMEDTDTRQFNRDTERTERTATLHLYSNVAYAETDTFRVDGEVWQQSIRSSVDAGVRTIKLQRKDGSRTSRPSTRAW